MCHACKSVNALGDFQRAFSERSEEKSSETSPLVDITNKIATFSSKSVFRARSGISRLLFNKYNYEKITREGEVLTVPKYRVSFCTNALLPNVDLIHYQTHDDLSHGHRFGGILSCGSVWHCPVCSSKISQYRAKEITNLHQTLTDSRGFSAFMLTLTVSHKKSTPLAESLDVIVKAFTYALNHRRFKEAFPDFLYVKSLEVTYGKNGWHPHIHALFFMPPFLSVYSPAIKDIFYPLVHSYFTRNGFSGSYKRAVDVVRSFTAAEYISKFGTPSYWRSGQELALAVYKEGHPFNLVESNPEKFCEYAENFHGRRQLTYSQKIKKIVPDFLRKSDEDVAESNDSEFSNDVVVSFSKEKWRFFQKNDHLDSLLFLAKESRESNYDLLLSFIDSLVLNKNDSS